jgi:hypothetical protein
MFYTVKLGCNELGCKQTLGYNEHIFRANWLFYFTNQHSYNEPRL